MCRGTRGGQESFSPFFNALVGETGATDVGCFVEAADDGSQRGRSQKKVQGRTAQARSNALSVLGCPFVANEKGQPVAPTRTMYRHFLRRLRPLVCVRFLSFLLRGKEEGKLCVIQAMPVIPSCRCKICNACEVFQGAAVTSEVTMTEYVGTLVGKYWECRQDDADARYQVVEASRSGFFFFFGRGLGEKERGVNVNEQRSHWLSSRS